MKHVGNTEKLGYTESTILCVKFTVTKIIEKSVLVESDFCRWLILLFCIIEVFCTVYHNLLLSCHQTT